MLLSQKKQLLEKHGKGVGVEHASSDSIRHALKDAQLMQDHTPELITYDDLITAGLIAGEGSKQTQKKIR